MDVTDSTAGIINYDIQIAHTMIYFMNAENILRFIITLYNIILLVRPLDYS